MMLWSHDVVIELYAFLLPHFHTCIYLYTFINCQQRQHKMPRQLFLILNYQKKP